jgi:3-methyl-2-oxobutanoate hydroxymethyltransferase
MPGRISVSDLFTAKQNGAKIVAVSCYDYTTARLVAQSGVEMILVGDSAAQLILGHDSTLPVSLDFMIEITAAVRRGAPEVCLVADMPFLSFNTGVGDAVRNAGRFFQQAGVQVVKIESSAAQLDVVKAVSDAGMAVMAHIGIRPQSIARRGVLRAEGTSSQMAYELIDLADRMVQAGAAMLLVEGTAREVAGIITERVEVPVISCGSGPDCDGQILIIHDILGLSGGKIPKFSKNYACFSEKTVAAVGGYAQEVRGGSFPDDEHCYHIKDGQLEELREMLAGPGE